MSSHQTKRDKNLIEATLAVAIYKEGDYYIAYCPALEISSYAKTIRQVKSEFDREVNIFFTETIRKGTLERLLLKYGWTLKLSDFIPPALSIGLTNKLKDYPSFKLQEEKVHIPYVTA